MAGCMTVSQEDPVTRASRSSLGDYATHLPKNPPYDRHSDNTEPKMSGRDSFLFIV